jgi:hypothetical protein
MKKRKNDEIGEYAKYNFALIDYDFDIQYIPAKKLKHADVLSKYLFI